ncbi:MAG: hypothetical protein ACPGO0_03315 [Acidimicrobiales bacterium]
MTPPGAIECGICANNEVPIATEVKVRGGELSDRLSRVLVVVSGVLTSINGGKEYHDVVSKWSNFKASIRHRSFPGVYTRANQIARVTPEAALGLSVKLDSQDEWGQPAKLPTGIGETVKLSNGVTIKGVALCFRQNRALLEVSAPGGSTIKGFRFSETQSVARAFEGFFRVQIFDLARLSNWMVVEEYSLEDPLKLRFWNPEKGRFTETSNNKAGQEHKIYFGSGITLQEQEVGVFDGDFLVPVGIKFPMGQVWAESMSWLKVPAPGTYEMEISGVFTFSGYATAEARMKQSLMGKFEYEAQNGGGGGIQDAVFRFDHIRSSRPPVYPSYLGPARDYRLKLFAVDPEGNIDQLDFEVYDSNNLIIDDARRRNCEFSPGHSYKVRASFEQSGFVRFFVDDKSIVDSSGMVARPGRIHKSWDNAGAFIVRNVRLVEEARSE